MTPKFDMVLEQCIETGLRLGYNRAFKHDHNPGEEVIFRKQYEGIMEEIYLWFDMEKKDGNEYI